MNKILVLPKNFEYTPLNNALLSHLFYIKSIRQQTEIKDL